MQSPSSAAGLSALSGIRVIDKTHHISGPTCTMLLGDYGAEEHAMGDFPSGSD